MTTIGTHNTLDGAAPGSGFADVLFYTEAIPKKLRAELAATHRLYVCRWQRDLCIAISRDLDVENVQPHYRLVHPGVPKVTPHRGVFWLTLYLDGERTALVCEHRINAAFPPFIRGEARFRPAMWRRHVRTSLRIIRRLIAKGRTVHAGGDLNTPRGVSGYDGALHEVGDRYDRLGSTRRLTHTQILSRLGSDHHRLRAEVEPRWVRP